MLGVPLRPLDTGGSVDLGALGLDHGQRHIVAVLKYVVRDQRVARPVPAGRRDDLPVGDAVLLTDLSLVPPRCPELRHQEDPACLLFAHGIRHESFVQHIQRGHTKYLIACGDTRGARRTIAASGWVSVLVDHTYSLCWPYLSWSTNSA